MMTDRRRMPPAMGPGLPGRGQAPSRYVTIAGARRRPFPLPALSAKRLRAIAGAF